MGALSRNKGANGERELARLLADELGTEVVRNLTQAREGGADLLGVDGWAMEVKRARNVTRALLRAWWAQAEGQAERAGLRPALAYRQDRGAWLVAVPLCALRPGLGAWPGLEWAATLSLPAWCALVRDQQPAPEGR